jgi:hypothetical protein
MVDGLEVSSVGLPSFFLLVLVLVLVEYEYEYEYEYHFIEYE